MILTDGEGDNGEDNHVAPGGRARRRSLRGNYPDLDISSCDDTIEDALGHLERAVLLNLDTREADGELERIFQEYGIVVEERAAFDHNVRIHPGVAATVSRSPVRVA